MSQERQSAQALEPAPTPLTQAGPRFTDERPSAPDGHKAPNAHNAHNAHNAPPTTPLTPQRPEVSPRGRRGSATPPTLNPALPLLSALTGAAITLAVAYYALPGESAAREVFTRSPLSQAVTLALFFWGLTLVYARLLSQRWEREQLAAVRRLVAPHVVSHLLRRVAARAEPSLSELRAPLTPLSRSLAGRLALSALTALHEEARRAAREGGARMESVVPATERALDACHADVRSDYKALTAILWLVPLSGFLGTVVGMSAAISSFDVLISGAGAQLSSLAPAVAGLATAFDTTLVALSLVVPLKLMEVSLERADERLLSDLDAQLGAGWLESLDLQSLSAEEQSVAQRAREAEVISEALVALSESARVADERLSALSRVSEALTARLHELSVRELSVRELSRESPERAALERELARRLEAIERHLALIHEQGERPLVLSRGAEVSTSRAGERR